MEKKEALKIELSKYEINFKYMTESGLLYPNIDLRRRKRLVQIYNEVFDKKERISTTCRNCMKMYVKELAGWYYSVPKEDAEETDGQEQPKEKIQPKPKKRARKSPTEEI